MRISIRCCIMCIYNKDSKNMYLEYVEEVSIFRPVLQCTAKRYPFARGSQRRIYLITK